MPPKQKLYCYVDETGQDTRGALFIVTVIITAENRDHLRELLEHIEQTSGKGQVKWIAARDDTRRTYISTILADSRFKQTINYARHHSGTDYLHWTVLTTARAVAAHTTGEYEATVFVDGLPKSKRESFGAALRDLNIKTKKIRGVRKEESDALVRLADAACGFVRAALSGRSELRALLDQAKAEGFIREL